MMIRCFESLAVLREVVMISESLRSNLDRWVMANFYGQLEKAFHLNSHKQALILEDRTWTYGDLVMMVDHLAAVLMNSDVAPEDRVVVQVEKSAENLALYLATLKIGAVYVPLNTAYTQKELDYFISDAEPTVFVGEAERDDVLSYTLDAYGEGSLINSIDPSSGEVGLVNRAGSDLASILYTSGTTGVSKGAMLTHENLYSNALALSDCWGWRSDDVLLHALPIFHVHGLFIASHCALLNGTPMVFLAKFQADEVLKEMSRCTVLMGVPTFYTRLLLQPKLTAASVANIRVFICGSAPLTEITFREWKERTGHEILERYGMSETIINTSNPLSGERVPGTVGFPLPRLSLRIADKFGAEVNRGEIGTIEVSGPAVFKGYWRMPEKTKDEIREDGFFITGDMGIQDEEGRVSIVGRAKDLVISGGFNVYPKEVESVIDELDGVLECAVIGVPHADFGEAVVAVVVPEDEEIHLNFLKTALAERLAKFKQPKAVVNVSELPRNTMGKVQKNLLRDRYSKILAD